mmetsp:Transcript_39184/g.113215  ORF Transcript_39184/g.113215 Transcript_39184/m.113215 type:complete len:172 (-) Transcript_39184:56-571(-)
MPETQASDAAQPVGCPTGRRRVMIIGLVLLIPGFLAVTIFVVVQLALPAWVAIAAPVVPLFVMLFFISSLKQAPTHPPGSRPTKCEQIVDIESFVPAQAVNEVSSADEPLELCCICLEPQEPGEMRRTLCCKHSFHASCVDGWWLRNLQAQAALQCPMCRQASLSMKLESV